VYAHLSHYSQLELYTREVAALKLTVKDLYTFDSLSFWTAKLSTALRPLALQAIRVLILPRSGGMIESAFSLVQLLQVCARLHLPAIICCRCSRTAA
jgi:hypothetical protein